MYDDRMEITFPGGMLNGSKIQDLDLFRVPSMRRNEIISDIFGRLHYMDRRGSGIGRIMNSYSDYIESPKFYSNDYFFSVVLSNRSVAELSQMEIVENQFVAEKSQLSPRNSETDWELSYFKDVVLCKIEEEFRGKTVKGIDRTF
jgi:ATP-dependent DNA helicase RecG